MHDLLTLYRDRLTDLTARNKSLRLMRLTNKNHFDLNSLSAIESGLPEKVVSQLCAQETTIPLFPINNFEEEEMLLSRRLVQLKRELDLIEQETGQNTFYVAYGFLEGFLVEDFYLRCPILFYPARLVRGKRGNTPYWMLEIDDDEPPFINRTFLLAVQKYLGITFPDNLERELESLPTDKEQVMPFLYDLLRSYKIPLRQPPETRIKACKAMKKADIPEAPARQFTLRIHAVMGKFQQSSSTLLVDYEEFLDATPDQGLLHRWLCGETEETELEEIRTEILNEKDEQETYFVLQTDASQEAVVVASHDRKGLIVHGPPGTGKSQVIVNLIADRLAKGQRVLLVCQKPAALDVVYNRLGAVELQSHVALVHDYATGKGDVYRKLANVLDKQPRPASQEHLQISREMSLLENRLNQVAHSLHVERPFGKRLYDLYTHAAWSQESILDVSDLLGDLTYQQLEQHLVELRTTLDLMQKYDHPQFPWVQRKSFASFTAAQQMELDRLLKPLVAHVNVSLDVRNRTELLETPRYYVENVAALEGLERALRMLQQRNLFKSILMFYRDEEREFETEDHFRQMKQVFGSLRKQLDVLSGRAEPVTHLTEAQAKEWSEKIRQFLELNQKLTRFVSGAWYNVRKQLKAHVEQQGLSFDGASVRRYLDRIESFLLYEKLRQDAQKHHLYSDCPTVNSPEEWEKWALLKSRVLDFLDLYVQAHTAFPNWLPYLQTQEELQRLSEPAFEQQVGTLLALAKRTQEMQDLVSQLSSYLQEDFLAAVREELEAGIYDVAKYQGLLGTLDSFDSLCRLDQMKAEMGDFKLKLIERCQEKSPIEQTVDLVEEWQRLILNSFLHAWILQVEREEPHVKDVSTEIYAHNLARYQELMAKKRSLVPAHIDHVLSTRSLEVTGATKRKVKTEAGKKRRQASLRTMLSSFTEEIFNLVPCWLCTPEVVSAIFPNRAGLFDLVIFDEASQCPVENAIPAIHRGKQVVVAGDEKQLPPSSFFQVSTDDEEEEDEQELHAYKDRTDREANSLLAWSKPRMADQWLTWHYRSKHQELINFSNYAFYGKRMQIAPSVQESYTNKPIEFRQVEGQWINRSNQVEADEVVDLVIDLLRHDPNNPTIGIVAFNKNQADLINDVFDKRMQADPTVYVLVEQARTRRIGDEHVGLFVKNIENVQGDERDVMVFSVGYAKNEEGKMVSQFGPLGQEFGSNRLNVAITRAKSKIYVVCSF
ncbi:MAG TPA: AAA domain-containing protein, partial [Bacilli bacterium]|nr:AAA domain-containing protein [Bacilli bacterium]